MGLHTHFVSSGPSCVADPGGDGFTLTGETTALEPPALRLVPSSGSAALIRLIEVVAPPELPKAQLNALRELWSEANGRVIDKPVALRGSGPVSLSVPPGRTDLPVLLRITYHEMNTAGGDPVGDSHRTIELSTTLHLPQAMLPDEPLTKRPPETGTGTETEDPTVHSAPETVTARRGERMDRVATGVVRHLGFAAVDFGTTNSTVTVHDMQQLAVRAMSRNQETRLRAELVSLLSDPAVPGPERAQWRELLGDVVRQLLQADSTAFGTSYLSGYGTGGPSEGDGPGHTLADALESGYGGENWLHALYTALELRLAARDERLRREVAPKLHACYDRAFSEVPLDVLRLFPADLDQSGGNELASRIEVVDTFPELRVRMGEERIAVGTRQESTPRAYRGLKQYLARDHELPELPTRQDGSPTTADDLIREGLRYLLDQSDEYIGANPKELHQGKIDHVVMTYPTVAPPAVRRRLRELVGSGTEEVDGLGVTIVDTRFDEAVAAALFFIMRDFGGDFAAGVEAFRARCRPTPGREHFWRQNILVVDVGGGTTDLAVINLQLRDGTPDPAPGQDTRFTGRLYVLTPTLLGSTGNLQLGGDLMTLRLFRWYKAAFADHLLTRWPDRYELVLAARKEKDYVVDGRYLEGALLSRSPDEDKYPHDLVEQVVPTRWAGDRVLGGPREESEQTFWLLWRMAEEAKIRLGAGDAVHQPLPETLDAVLGRLHAPEPAEDAEGAEDMEWAPRMDTETFEGLMKPVLKEITDLVASLAKNALKENQELDRIFLTGKSSRMPLVRRSLERRLRQETEVRWNPAGIEVEEEYGKLATSIGACWGYHIRRFAHAEQAAHGVLGRGRYVLRIEVDNLSYYLPCDFGPTFQLEAGEPTDTLLTMSTELSPIGPDGAWAVRSKWTNLTESLRIHRNTGPKWQAWGAFDPDAWVRREEPGFVLNMDEWVNQVKFQLEVDADLNLDIHLARGEEHYEVGGETSVRVDLDGGADTPWTPVEIVADNRVAGDRPDAGTVVFRLTENPWLPATDQPPLSDGPPLEPPGDRFDKWLRGSGAPGAAAVRGMQSKPLEPPGHDGWIFYLRRPGEPDREMELIDIVPAPGREGWHGQDATHGGSKYVATLDEHWGLRVHRLPVPYWEAGSVAEMWTNPGAVFRVTMEDATSEHIAERDPFNGRH
ncbi:Hsp70 family protein [Streptomyces sp. NBC_01381]|uniref:Hsp70 family protein n=1 Tax=Streptomyces sp. NBC_01381 TaxID=2903845 RepID=UPI00224EF7C8|nr:Hsp70 family protein [Streptomyces sp. NBC_01381]MCX4671950.1 Hsp70 family protein [Streptomyces sp. NBC_01381]